MKVRVPDYYDQFKCIAGACTDTCCAGWQVDVDDDTYAYYKTVKGEFGERLHSVMVDGRRGEEGSFRIRPDGRCPFLNDNNLCDLYTALGEDALCVTCDQYPRFTARFGNLRETGIALSCKTACELILKENRTPGFKEYEAEDEFLMLNNIDGALYLALMKARSKAYEIIWNRQYNIFDRLTVLLDYGGKINKLIKHPEQMEGVEPDYSVISANCDIDCIDSYRRIWKHYLKLYIIKKEWPKLIGDLHEKVYDKNYAEINSSFASYYRDREYEYENLVTYFIFRYFMKALEDGDVLSKIKMCIVPVLLIRQGYMVTWLSADRQLDFVSSVDIAHLYSREIEHSEENYAALNKLFKKKKEFKSDRLQQLLGNCKL